MPTNFKKFVKPYIALKFNLLRGSLATPPSESCPIINYLKLIKVKAIILHICKVSKNYTVILGAIFEKIKKM